MIVFNGETLLTIYEHAFERIGRRPGDESNVVGGIKRWPPSSINRRVANDTNCPYRPLKDSMLRHETCTSLSMLFPARCCTCSFFYSIGLQSPQLT